MIFDTNQTEFPTPKHKAVWNTGRQIVPLEVSLADITDAEMKEGCSQIYDWTQEYLESMYTTPDKYSGCAPNGMFRVLQEIAENAAIVDDGLVFTKEKYNNILKAKADYISDLPLVGLHITGYGNSKILTNKQYPLFCKYFKLFYDAALKKKVNRGDYLEYNDFRVLAPKYRRIFDDLLRTLPDKQKGYASEMHEYALAKGAKLEPHKYYCYFRYKYKKENLLMLQRNNWRHTPLDIAVPYGLSGKWDSAEDFLKIAESQPDHAELIAYIQKEICKCDACGARKNASERCVRTWTDIRGARRLLSGCHRDISKWKAPKSNLDYDDYDIKMLKRMIDIRVTQIDNLK